MRERVRVLPSLPLSGTYVRESLFSPSFLLFCGSVCVGEEGAGRVLVVQNRGVSALVTALSTHGDTLTIVLPCLQTLAALTEDAVRVFVRKAGGGGGEADA